MPVEGLGKVPMSNIRTPKPLLEVENDEMEGVQGRLHRLV